MIINFDIVLLIWNPLYIGNIFVLYKNIFDIGVQMYISRSTRQEG